MTSYDEGWRRLHPLTPLIRGWKVVLAVLAIVTQQRSDEIFSGDGIDTSHLLVWLGILAAALVVGMGYSVLAWRMSTFRLGDEALVLKTGVLFRQERQARLDRLQAVDVVQPLLARFAGLAEIRVEVAGGSGSAVRLSFLREEQAQALRRELLARAAGVEYDAGSGPAPEAPEHLVLEVPAGRVLASAALGGPTIGLAVVAAGLVTGFVLTGSIVFVTSGLPGLLGAGAVVWNRFASSFGFRVATSPDGLRLRHGLLTTRAQTVPPGRVQAVRISQPLLWRHRGWWTVEVNVAGYAGGQDGDTSQENVVLPVGTREEALRVVALVLPDLGVDGEDPVHVADAALVGLGPAGGFTGSPRQARWLDPVGWRRNGFRVTATALITRHGRLRRCVAIVPHQRTQSLGIRQGPLQRRLGVASFVVHSTPGPVKPSVAHLDGATAAALLADQAARARAARATDHDHRWMTRPAVPPTQEAPGAPRG